MAAPMKDKKSSGKKRGQLDDSRDGVGLSAKKSKIEVKINWQTLSAVDCPHFFIYVSQLKDSDDDDEEEEISLSAKSKSKVLHNSAVDITADELVPLLTPENVANLVLLSMVRS